MAPGFVCLMGMGIVFIGLICIVLICNIMSFFVMKFTNSSAEEPAAPAAAAAPQISAELPPEEKRAIIAGTCACIAEELGTTANNIRVLSFKKIG